MASSWSQKAPFNDWWYWSECLVARLKTMSELYKENGEGDRAGITSDWAKKLKDNCMTPVMAARKGMKTDAQKRDVKALEETAIFNAVMMFKELLINLPPMSDAIQNFLSINWQDYKWPDPKEKPQDNGDKKKKGGGGDTRIATLFWGPKERQDEGIRSGKVADGGLPGILYNLLMAERTSSNRAPTDYGSTMMVAANTAKASNALNMKPGGGM